MKLEFESIEEVKEFVTKLKGTRGGKADKEDGEGQPASGQAPAPLAPPANPQTFNPGNGAGFAPPAGGATQAGGAGGATQAGGAFPVHVATGPAPEVLALVTRISARIDGAIASGQDAAQVLSWFRGQCGAEAANATMDQIKASFLPKLSVPSLEGIAKLMNA